VIPAPVVLLPFTGISLADLFPRYGLWMYLLVFVIIMAASTIAGGPIPDNTFLLLTGAVAPANGLSVVWLLVMAAAGGFAGYEINYWSGRWFGLTVCRGVCPVVLRDGNVRNALTLMDRYGPASMILSRFLPVMNLPSFVAGADAMEYRRYIIFNLVSSAVWSGTLLLSGYYIGSTGIISGYLDYLTDIFIVILAVAILVVLFTLARDLLRRKDGSAAD
jgi:membrane-associated protein